MKQRKLVLAIAIAMGVVSLGVANAAEAKKAPKSPHQFRGTAGLEFSTNDNINVARASTDRFDFADFGDFAEAADKLGDDDEEDDDEGEEDEGDAFADDDFDDIGFDETDLSEDEFELAFDDDDGDGEDDDDDDDDDGDDGDGDGKRADEDSLDDLLNDAFGIKAATRKQSQNRYTASVGLAHKFVFEGGVVTWGSTVRGVGDYHINKSNLNKTNFAASTGPEFNLKDIGLKLKPALSYISIRQNDKGRVAGTLVGTLAAGYDVNKQFGVDVVYNYQDRDVTDPDSPDAIVNTLTFGAEFIASKNDIFKARYSPKVEDSSQVTKNKDTEGYQFTYSRKLPWEMILGLGVKNDTVDFKNLPNRREDDVRAYSIQLAKAWSKRFEMAMSYETRDLDSSIDNKDAKNKSFSIQGTWKF